MKQTVKLHSNDRFQLSSKLNVDYSSICILGVNFLNFNSGKKLTQLRGSDLLILIPQLHKQPMQTSSKSHPTN